MDLNQSKEERFTDEEMSEVDRLQSDPSSEYYYNDPDNEEGFLDKVKRKLEPYGEDFKGFVEYLFTPSRHFGTGQYKEGGVAEQMEMFGYTAEGAQQEADKFVGEAENLEEDISKAVSFVVPFYDSGVNISNVVQEYMKPEQERDYDYIKNQFTEAGQSAAIEGGLLLMGGVAGKYGAKGIKALADKVKQYEIDPTAMSAFGAGSIRKKAVDPLEIGINKALQDGKFLKRYDASIAADMTEKVKNATAGNTRANALINTAVPEGTKVGIRLNLNSKIPDMPKGLDKLQTLHKGSFSGKALSYLPFATVKNVVFSVNQTGRTGIASKIKGIDTPEAKSKFNAMSVDGEYVPNKNLLDSNKDLVEIGFNPGVHHLFIDLKTGQAVRGAKEATVIGDRVFAKGVEYWKKAEAPKPVPTQTGVNIPSDVRYKFKRGGAVMDDQMQMAFMDEGGIADDGMDVDPVSGNEVPPGSLAEEVRDDIPAQLSEGEYVVPADVVRYYGVKFFEDLRDQAKMGLADMEANGRIGGEPVPAGGPKNENLTPEEQQAVEAMMGMEQGGAVQNPYLQQQQLYNQEPSKAVGNTMGYAEGGGSAPVNQLQAQAITPTVYNQPNYSFLSPSTTTQTSQTTEQAINQATQNVFTPVMMRSPEGVEAEAKTREQMKKWLAEDWVIITAAETTTTPTETTTPTDTTITPTTPTRTGGGGTNITVGDKSGTGGFGFGFKNWGKDVDWSDPDSIKTFVENSTQGLLDPKTGKKITEVGFGIAGPIGGALGAAASTVPSLGSLSDLRASRFILKAQGMETDFVDAQIKKITDNASGFTNFIDKVFGEVADGDAKGRAALDRLGLEYTRDEKTGDPTFSEEQIASNIAKAKKAKRPATGTITESPRPKSRPDDLVKVRTDSTGKKAGDVGYESALRKRQKDKRKKNRINRAANEAAKKAQKSTTKKESISQKIKRGGGFDKGGLMNKKGNK